MSKSVTKRGKRSVKAITLGREGFAKICAIEGIRLSPQAIADLEEFDRKGLSPEEKRAAIRFRYGKRS